MINGLDHANYNQLTGLYDLRATTLSTEDISYDEIQTLNNIDTSKTIQVQLNNLQTTISQIGNISISGYSISGVVLLPYLQTYYYNKNEIDSQSVTLYNTILDTFDNYYTKSISNANNLLLQNQINSISGILNNNIISISGTLSNSNNNIITLSSQIYTISGILSNSNNNIITLSSKINTISNTLSPLTISISGDITTSGNILCSKILNIPSIYFNNLNTNTPLENRFQNVESAANNAQSSANDAYSRANYCKDQIDNLGSLHLNFFGIQV
jgi:hypothetical protein